MAGNLESRLSRVEQDGLPLEHAFGHRCTNGGHLGTVTPDSGRRPWFTGLDGHGTTVRALHDAFRLEFVEVPPDRRSVDAEGMCQIIDALKPALLQENCNIRAT